MNTHDEPDFESVEAQHRKRTLVVPLALMAVAAVTATFFFFLRDRGEGPPPDRPPLSLPEPSPAPGGAGPRPAQEGPAGVDAEPPAGPSAGEPAPPALPSLGKSDALVRQFTTGLFAGGLPPSWLEGDDLVRLFVVVVDNIAEGASPRAHLPFVGIKERFSTVEKAGRLYVDPETFHRYDGFAAVVVSLDAGACARAYQDLKPLFQEAYRDLGYPDRSFDSALKRAIGRLLGTPVPEGDIELLEGEKAFHFEDPDLEALTLAEKHLVRMGPVNERKIKAALRALADALGFAP